MQVKSGDRLCLDAPARVEPADDLLFHDYYTRTPRIRLVGDATDQSTEVMLDAADVASVVAGALRHPGLNMRQAALAAIWNHPESVREIFRFGLDAPVAFGEVRRVVAEELARQPEAAGLAATPPSEALLPRMPLPAHLQRRKRG